MTKRIAVLGINRKRKKNLNQKQAGLIGFEYKPSCLEYRLITMQGALKSKPFKRFHVFIQFFRFSIMKKKPP